MRPPVKGKTVLALDPGYRTGCKTAVVDSTGKVLDTTVIYPTHSDKKIQESKQTLLRLIKKSIMLILFQSATVLQAKKPRCSQPKQSKRLTTPLYYMVVSEAGASVYSASKLAATELPDLDLTLEVPCQLQDDFRILLQSLLRLSLRQSVSVSISTICRRKKLGETLDGVVEDCVNSVGADLNTASPALFVESVWT